MKFNPMLETSGIMRVEPAATYHKLVLLKADAAEQAIEYHDRDLDSAVIASRSRPPRLPNLSDSGREAT